MQPSNLSPSEEYNKRLQTREQRVAHFEQLHIRYGNLRLSIVVATVVAAWFSLHREAFSPWWLLLSPAIFIAIAIVHAKILRDRACAERAVDFYRKGLARIEDRWRGTGAPTTPIDTHTSLYASDLDLFGEASLFQLLSLARTRMGEETLAAWLLAPAPIAEITQRHAALTELRPCLDLREDIAILGPISGEDLKVGIHPKALTQWAEAPNLLTRPWLRWVSLLLAIAAIAGAIIWAQLGTKTPFFAIVIIETIITASVRNQIAAVFNDTDRALADLQLLSSLLARLEREPFQSSRLQTLKAQITSHHLPGSQAIARLRNIVEYIRSRDNVFTRLLDIPLLYSVQVAYAAEAWRAAHGAAVRSWLNAIGDAEALLSLSAYSYEHPADPFPEFVTSAPCLIAQQLGHPLIPAAKCIRNNVEISDKTRLLIISGSNMSGKSTLLRAVGINTVLAMAGAPVRADKMKLTPLQIGASILINDSLQDGSSRFYAEITRLQHICELAEKNPPVLFLLDELLQGTNSNDRLTGAEGVVCALLAAGAVGIITTHDLALTNIGNQSNSRNAHFQDHIEDGKMKFDYKLQEGVVTKSNGIELMRLIGLKV
ncbi:MAG TPA: hypothetical protein VNU92_05625 [Edaphobacter sp.]|nr:hypothetical protein [Edaphobacter sp.]